MHGCSLRPQAPVVERRVAPRGGKESLLTSDEERGRYAAESVPPEPNHGGDYQAEPSEAPRYCLIDDAVNRLRWVRVRYLPGDTMAFPYWTPLCAGCRDLIETADRAALAERLSSLDENFANEDMADTLIARYLGPPA